MWENSAQDVVISVCFMMGEDHSSIICAITELLSESYRDSINRSAALSNDKTVSLLDKFQIIAKAFIWI